ncbi:protein kinase domain-containing protein [Sorangium sp. So ce1099]|uniref:serine/threonine-protein kinase n=1 Tax=Sorangium sp. So ce1099 TaxID=3133331 RepID=UPI003F6223AD
MSDVIEAYRLLPGMLLARKYRLTRRIGQGAMGVVWAATNESTGREVAVKLIARPDPSLRKRLLREAQSCGALQHPNIVDVIDVTRTESGEPCMIMELLVGESVAALLEARRRLDAPLAARIAHDVAGALGAAHAVQIVHRDLKPANIFVHRPPDADGFVVKVLDFGVAKNLADARGVSSTMDAAVGSPFYMSPEQVRADGDVDGRTDLWALGVVLFEMLTGVRPFQGEGPQLLSQILSGEIPKVSRYLRRVDERLVSIVDRCLRRERAERFAAAEEVARALSELMLPAGARGAAAAAQGGVGAPPEVSAAAAEAGAGAGWRESQTRTATHAGERARPAPLSRTASEQETVVAPERGQGRAPTPDELATTVPVKPVGQPQRGGAQAPAQTAQGRIPAGGAGGGAPAAGAAPMVTPRGTLVMRGQTAAAYQQAAEVARAQALAQRADVERASAQPAAREREGGKAERRPGKGKAAAATLVVGLIVGVLAATWIVGWERASDAPAGEDAGRAPGVGMGAVQGAPPAVTQAPATGAPEAVASSKQPAETGARANAPGSDQAGPTDVNGGGKGKLAPGTVDAVKAGEGQGERPSRAAEAAGTAGQRAPASGTASAQQKKRPPENRDEIYERPPVKRDEIYEEMFGAPAPAAPGASPAVGKPAPEKKPPAPTRPFD